MKKFLMFLCAMMLVFGIVGTASATTTYLDEATFLTNIASDYYFEGFDSYTYGSPSLGTDADFGPVNGYSWHAHADDNLWANNSALSTNGEGDPITITFTGDDVTAVGGEFASTDIDGNIIGQQILVTLNDGTSTSFIGSGFAGFTSQIAIISLAITPFSDPEYNWAQVDSFYTGSAAPVPEPSTFLLMGAGLIGLVGYNRKRFSKKKS